MKRQLIWLIISTFLLISMVLASCSQATSSTSSTQSPTTSAQTTASPLPSSSATVSTTTLPPTTTVTTANWWDQYGTPQYGGTLTYSVTGLMGLSFDPYVFIGADNDFWYDTMFAPNWTVSRDEWPFNTDFIPDQYWSGNLVQSWVVNDPQTITCNIRQGVHWQNKAPVNGREFTADDVAFHYDRILGTGHGYTVPSPLYAGMTSTWQGVTATDKFTVVFKFKQPSAQNFQSIANMFALSQIEAPEWVALGGPPQNQTTTSSAGAAPPAAGGPPPAPPLPSGPLGDWHTVVGTGPWMLTDLVSGSSFTYSKNPDYWGRDARYPDNQVPYADKLSLLIIPDTSTQLAAMRTGKIDLIANLDWNQASTLTKSNPDLTEAKVPAGSNGIAFRIDKAPFTDIKVREALNMAIDRQAIAKSIYGGTSDGNPVGYFSTAFKGYAFPYQDWPQDLKDGYSYNPDGAKQLLTEAGYPNGFKTDVDMASGDTSLMVAFKSMFAAIGVDMAINTFDSTTYEAMKRNGKIDQMMAEGGAVTITPTSAVGRYYSKQQDAAMYGVNDPSYDALYDKFFAATTPTEVSQSAQAIDKYILEQYWIVQGPETNTFKFWQPWLKEYNGEQLGWGQQYYWARFWTTQK